MSAVSASLLAAGWLLALPQAPTEEVPGSAAATLVEFEIKDQFGEVYTDEPYREGVFVLVGSDRKGSEFSRAWSEAIRESLDGLPDEAEVQLAGLAHVNGVPRLIRGLVRRAFPKHPDAWVLLDWKGIFEEAYGYEVDNTTVLVFLDSTLIHRTYGQEVEAEKVEALRDAVDEALRSGKTEAVATVDEEPQ